MRIISLAFLLGVLILQKFSYLPAEKWVWIIFIFSSSMIFLGCYFRRYLLINIAAIGLGFVWCLWFAHMHMAWSLPDNFEGETVTAIGYVASIPSSSKYKTDFIFDVKKLELENSKISGSLVRLSWQGKNLPEIHVGDRWQLAVRLKKIYSTMNPGGFDYEARALQEGIRAHGYVYVKGENKLLDSRWYHHPLDRIREHIKSKIEANLPRSNTSPWIIALVLGERQSINPEYWEILRNTGTNHLMAIAGLHIGFMSGLIYFIVSWLWRRSPKLILKRPAQHAGAIASLIMAMIYSAMAGFSIPTQRACLMLTAFLLILLLRRKILSWYAWSLALLIVLFINPLDVQTESFWLSFGAVALIIFGVSGRLAPKGLWWKWGRIQWVIGLGLIPLSIWLFQQCSLISFLANSIAIPWMGFLIVPLSIIGSFLLFISAKLGTMILIFADKLLALLWIILTWFSHLSWASWYQIMPNYFILIMACVGILFLLAPVGFPGRWFGIIWLLPLFTYQAPTPNLGNVWFTLLDVGQGLSAVVQTKNHILIFDAGAKLSPSYDMGESVVVPYLRSIGTKHVDMLVVSHGDNDHIGGAPAILKRFPVNAVKTSVPKELPTQNTSYCLRGESWNWDNVNFEFLYPTENTLGFDNDSSCVLRVTMGNKHILLTGDIEKYAEKNLVSNEFQKLSADILVAPHHGSKTSAEDDFLQGVKPIYVLYPIGYRNRYHFPNEIVVEKYQSLGAKQFDTAKSGAIEFLIDENKEVTPILYRSANHHFWN